MGGQVDMMMADIPVVLPFIQSGKPRALAVTNSKRIPILKDVPTVVELGLPKVEVYNWYGKPAEIVNSAHRGSPWPWPSSTLSKRQKRRSRR